MAPRFELSLPAKNPAKAPIIQGKLFPPRLSYLPQDPPLPAAEGELVGNLSSVHLEMWPHTKKHKPAQTDKGSVCCNNRLLCRECIVTASPHLN